MFCPFDRGFKCADCPFTDYGKNSKSHRTHICNKLTFSMGVSAASPSVRMKKGPDGGRGDIS